MWCYLRDFLVIMIRLACRVFFSLDFSAPLQMHLVLTKNKDTSARYKRVKPYNAIRRVRRSVLTKVKNPEMKSASMRINSAVVC